jgi:hypothetical protein
MFVKSMRIGVKKTAIAVTSISAIGMTTIAVAQDDAQTQTQQRLLACDRISNTEDRLECFNAVVGGLKQAPSAPVAKPPAPVAETPDKPAAIVPPAPAVVESVPGAPAAVINEVAEPPPAAPAATVNETAGVPPMAPTAASGDFGLEDHQAKAARQAEREKKKEEQFEVLFSTIVEVRQSIDGRFEARLENGQVWRETEATRTVRRPKVGDSVRITPGRLGSYRMKFNNDNRLAAVRRIE